MANSSNQDSAYSSPDHGLGQSIQIMKPGLYLVATPIGNLRDITLRALDILQAAAVVYCEDTRVTQKLFAAYGIKTKLERCDEHTEGKRVDDMIAQIRAGKIMALVSDAGTPGISDPGTIAAKACRDAGLNVFTIPGANAAIAAVAASGLTAESFLFLGFPPAKAAARRAMLQAQQQTEAILVFYEAPQRVIGLLQDIQLVMGERFVVVARELTKLHEQFYRGPVAQVIAALEQDDVRGEIVVLVAPGHAVSIWTEGRITEELRTLLQSKSLKEAVAEMTAQSGLPRKVIYARALALQDHD